MNPHAWLLAFLLYSVADDHAAEPGHIIARSCAAAEQYLRAGLLAHQRVMIGECVAYREGMGW